MIPPAWNALAVNRFGLPPADGPGIASIGASRDEIVPSKSKCCEQQGAHANRRNQKAPGHIIDNNNQRIDPGRRVKRVGQMHCDHRQTNSDGGGPRRWAAQFHNQQSDERGDKMTADSRKRLSRECWREQIK
jgi:hypothetical protein